MTIKKIIEILRNEDPYNPDIERRRNDNDTLAQAIDETIKALYELEKTKAELEAVKKELAELKSLRSWELYPDMMGK